jgi:hypothetical protein
MLHGRLVRLADRAPSPERIFDPAESNHHFLVTRVEGDTVHTIDGNLTDPEPTVLFPNSGVVGRTRYKILSQTSLQNPKMRVGKKRWFLPPDLFQSPGILTNACTPVL